MAPVRRLNAWFDRLLYVGTATSAMLLFGVVLVSILSRYILHRPILASIELSRLFFVWSCFPAAALTYRRRAHVGFTLVFERFPIRMRRWLSVLIHLLIVAFCGVVFYHSILVTRMLWPTNLPMLGISQAWFYVPVPVLCVALVSYTLEFLADGRRAGEATP